MSYSQVSIAELRTSKELNTITEYFTAGIERYPNGNMKANPNVKGFWSFDDEPGAGWMDNLGTILFNEIDEKIVRRVFSGPVNVKWFNAKGDGVTDDTEAVQKAINACQIYGIGYGTLYFPTGVYRVDELTISPSNQAGNLFGKLTICGDGKFHSIIKHNPYKEVHGSFPTSVPQTGKSILTIKSPFVNIKDIGFEGTVLTPGKTYQTGPDEDPLYWAVSTITYVCNGVLADGNAQDASTNHFFVDNAVFRSFEVGIDIVGGVGSKISNCLFGGMGGDQEIGQTCNYGIKTMSATYMCPNAISINDCTFNWCKTWALQFENGNLLTLNDCIFEQNGNMLDGYGNPNAGAVHISGDLNIGQEVALININSCWFEANMGFGLLYENQSNGVIFNLNQDHFIAYDDLRGGGVNINATNAKTNKVNVIGCNSEIPLNMMQIGTFVINSSFINIFGSSIAYPYYVSPNLNIIG